MKHAMVCVLSLCGLSAMADNWLGGSGNFFDGAKWNTGAVPGSTKTVVFPNIHEPATVTFGGAPGTHANTWLAFNTITAPFILDLNGWRWTINGPGYNQTSTGMVSIKNGTIGFDGDRTFEIANTAPAAGLVLDNGGTLEVKALKLKTGTARVAAGGTLDTQSLALANETGNDAVVIIEGGVMKGMAATSYAGMATGAATGTLAVASGVLDANGSSFYFHGGSAFTLENGCATNLHTVTVNGTAAIHGGVLQARTLRPGNGAGNNGAITIHGGVVRLDNNITLATATTATGTVTVTGGDINAGLYVDHSAGCGTLTIDGGTFTVERIRTGVNSGQATPQSSFTLNLTGGRLNVTQGYGIDAGLTGMANTLNLTGGTFTSTAALDPGAGKNFTLNLHGGTLAAPSVNANNLAGGVLRNNGATLAPGGTGAPGIMTITGDYTETSPAALDFDIGGIASGTQFDVLYIHAVGATATLAGQLRLRLLDGYVPEPSRTFYIIRYRTLGAGSHFANVDANNHVFTEDGLFRFTLVNNTEPDVKMFGVTGATRNERNTTGGTWAEGWTLGTAPGIGNTYAAWLGTLGGGAISLSETVALRGLVFTNTLSYAVNGTGSIDAAYIHALAGTHEINVPVAHAQPLGIHAAQNAALKIAAPAALQGIAKTGAGELILTGADTTLATLGISEGMVSFNGCLTLDGAFTVGAGALNLQSGRAELRFTNLTAADAARLVDEAKILFRGQPRVPGTVWIKELGAHTIVRFDLASFFMLR